MNKAAPYLFILLVIGLVSYVIVDEQQKNTVQGERALSESSMRGIGETQGALDALADGGATRVADDIKNIDAKKAEAANIDTQATIDRQEKAERLSEQETMPGSVGEFNPR
ncbi:MAG TPA: hypothetical protein VJH55_02870 [Candidatus Paceibacterota bacterium]